MQSFFRRIRDEYLLSGFEEMIQAAPWIADDRRAAPRGFEETDAGRPAGADHVDAGDVQCEALRTIEGAVLRGCKMRVPADVAGPADGGGAGGRGGARGWGEDIAAPQRRSGPSAGGEPVQ